MTNRRGELANQDIDVLIVDASGEVLVDEQVTTFDNGFVGFWLPREVEGTVAVSYVADTGQSSFSTCEEGATCLTTLRLTHQEWMTGPPFAGGAAIIGCLGQDSSPSWSLH